MADLEIKKEDDEKGLLPLFEDKGNHVQSGLCKIVRVLVQK